jgi:hypothetical protein
MHQLFLKATPAAPYTGSRVHLHKARLTIFEWPGGLEVHGRCGARHTLDAAGVEEVRAFFAAREPAAQPETPEPKARSVSHWGLFPDAA